MRYKTKTILVTLIIVNLFHVNTNAQQAQQPQVYQVTAKEAVDLAFFNKAIFKHFIHFSRKLFQSLNAFLDIQQLLLRDQKQHNNC